MTHIVTIPIRTHEDFGHSLGKLLRVLSSMQGATSNHFVLDFNEARMLNPFFLGGLACTIKHYERIGKTIELNHHNNYAIRSYLDAICFPGCYTPQLGLEGDFIKQLDNYQSKRYIPIIAFPTGKDQTVSSMREKILSAVSTILRKQLHFSETHLMPISYMIDELTHNINDHADVPEGFVFAQYYPASNYIDLCICDSGIGILQSYQKTYKFNPKDEQEAIRFAVQGYSTKDIPESKGFGISTSRDMLVNGLKGKFFLMSGNTAYIQTAENQGILDLPDNFYYQGNYVALRIPTIIDASFNMYSYIE